MNAQNKTLLSVVELGGYPNFLPLYQAEGFQASVVSNTRKAIAAIKQQPPAVIVAEFNYQSDFRDRTSSLESLLAAAERHGHSRVIVFFEPDSQHQLERLLPQFQVFATLAFPIDEEQLRATLRAASTQDA